MTDLEEIPTRREPPTYADLQTYADLHQMNLAIERRVFGNRGTYAGATYSTTTAGYSVLPALIEQGHIVGWAIGYRAAPGKPARAVVTLELPDGDSVEGEGETVPYAICDAALNLIPEPPVPA